MGITTESFETSAEAPDTHDVRAAVAEAMAQDGLSQMGVATRSGVAHSTLSAWLNGTYKGNNDGVADKLRVWLQTRTAASRTRAAIPDAPRFLLTPTASAILDVLEIAQTVPDIAVIAGAAGIGKTSAAEYYRSQNSNVWLVTMEPSYGTMGAVLRVLAEALGLAPNRGAGDLSDSIRRRLTGTSGLLIFDEAQNLRPEFVDQIRGYHDRAGVGIALMGNQTVASRYGRANFSEAYAPLFSRVGQRLRQKGPKTADIKMLVDAWGLSDVDAAKAAIAVGKMPGAARTLTKVLRMAHLLASSDGRKDVSVKDVEAAWAQLSDREGGVA